MITQIAINNSNLLFDKAIDGMVDTLGPELNVDNVMTTSLVLMSMKPHQILEVQLINPVTVRNWETGKPKS